MRSRRRAKRAAARIKANQEMITKLKRGVTIIGTKTYTDINSIWKDVCSAGVGGKTPHSARHAMGRHILEKTGNVAAVQRQLGHKNAAYSSQYARVPRDELNTVLDERE